MPDYRRKILRALSDRTEKIPDDELFSSPEYQELFLSLTRIQGSTPEMKRKLSGDVVFINRPDFTACTDGNRVIISYGSDMLSNCVSRRIKHRALQGFKNHEDFHKLYTDFGELKTAVEKMDVGEWYPENPYEDTDTSDEANFSREIMSTVKSNPELKGPIISVWKNIQNIIEDAYIEIRGVNEYPAVAENLAVLNSLIYENTKPLDAWDKELNTMTPEEAASGRLSAFCQSILTYGKTGVILMEDEQYSSPLVCDVFKSISDMDDGMTSDSQLGRFAAGNTIMSRIWGYAKDCIDQISQEEDVGGEGDSSESQSDQLKKVLEDLAKLLKDKSRPNAAINPDTSAPVAPTTPTSKDSAANAREKVKAAQEKQKQSNGEPDIAVHNIAKAIAQAQLEEETEKEHEDDLKKELGSFCGNTRISVKRPKGAMVPDYNRFVSKYKLLEISKRLQREMMSLLKDKIEGGKTTRLTLGKRISTRDLAREDDNFFERRRDPQDKADISVCVLIDESGSMSGTCINEAKKTAIILEDWLRNMSIPCFILGHRDCSRVELPVYVDFDKADSRDRYRLMEMTASGGTPTANALKACYEKMKRRTEGNKLIIVITDGEPGDNYDKSIEKMIAAAHRHNVDIFGVGIAGCADSLSRIYGNRMIAINDVTTLPREMCRLVKRFVRFTD